MGPLNKISTLHFIELTNDLQYALKWRILEACCCICVCMSRFSIIIASNCSLQNRKILKIYRFSRIKPAFMFIGIDQKLVNYLSLVSSMSLFLSRLFLSGSSVLTSERSAGLLMPASNCVLTKNSFFSTTSTVLDNTPAICSESDWCEFI